MSETTANLHGNQPDHATDNGRAKAVSQPSANGHARNKTLRRAADQREITALIEQAESIRDVLRSTLLKNNELLKALNRHRSRSRIVANTLASLRQLKTIGV